jgi:hypothetical protein
MLDPAQHDLPYLRDKERLCPEVDAKLAEAIVCMNAQRINRNGEMIPAASIENARSEISSCHTFFSLNMAVIKKTTGSKHSTESLKLIAAWWGEHRAQFPLLARTARGLLATRVTSVNNERAFSSAGAEYSQKRQAMLPETLEALSLIRGNVGADLSLDQIVAVARDLSVSADIFEETDANPEQDNVDQDIVFAQAH